jgi:hypothetical protein
VSRRPGLSSRLMPLWPGTMLCHTGRSTTVVRKQNCGDAGGQRKNWAGSLRTHRPANSVCSGMAVPEPCCRRCHCRLVRQAAARRGWGITPVRATHASPDADNMGAIRAMCHRRHLLRRVPATQRFLKLVLGVHSHGRSPFSSPLLLQTTAAVLSVSPTLQFRQWGRQGKVRLSGLVRRSSGPP